MNTLLSPYFDEGSRDKMFGRVYTLYTESYYVTYDTVSSVLANNGKMISTVR